MEQYNTEQLVAYLEATLRTKLKLRRIRSITVNPSSHDQPKMCIVQDQYCADLEPGRPPEKVVGIFETSLFLVCTAQRGAGEGLPYFFARQDVRKVEYL